MPDLKTALKEFLAPKWVPAGPEFVCPNCQGALERLHCNVGGPWAGSVRCPACSYTESVPSYLARTCVEVRPLTPEELAAIPEEGSGSEQLSGNVARYLAHAKYEIQNGTFVVYPPVILEPEIEEFFMQFVRWAALESKRRTQFEFVTRDKAGRFRVTIEDITKSEDAFALDDAIRHAQEVAFGGDKESPCAKEHEQLARWLTELKERRG